MKVETKINPKIQATKHELNVCQRRQSREGPQIESLIPEEANNVAGSQH